MSQNEPTTLVEATDMSLRRLREGVTALISLLVIGGTLWLVFLAIQNVSSATDQGFSRLKDLLLFLNPLLGVVIGYYFNKTTSEARAENAESAAKRASATATVAVQAQSKAQDEANKAQADAAEAKKTLSVLVDASEKALVQSRGGTLSAEGAGAANQSQVESQSALDRAKSLLR